MSSYDIPELDGKRIRLRPHTEADLGPSQEMWSNERVTQFVHTAPQTRHETWMKIIRFTGLWAFCGYGYWAIEEKETGRFVGQAGFADFKRELAPPMPEMPEAGWAIHPAFMGQGYATEAMKLALGWFDQWAVHCKSFCLIHPENAASIRVAEKLGFVGRHTYSHNGKCKAVMFRTKSSKEAHGRQKSGHNSTQNSYSAVDDIEACRLSFSELYFKQNNIAFAEFWTGMGRGL